jgi:hypothetical protein
VTTNYRSPEEYAEGDVEDAYIRDVLGQAMANCTSLLAAMQLREPPHVVDEWCDALYDDLRDSLTPEQRIRAVILMIQLDAEQAAKTLTTADDVAVPT